MAKKSLAKRVKEGMGSAARTVKKVARKARKAVTPKKKTRRKKSKR
jgi:hypothetical protein